MMDKYMTKQELINRFYEDGLNSYDWERYDRTDDYCWECGCEYETEDGYTYSADATECCGDYEIFNLTVKTPSGEEITLI